MFSVLPVARSVVLLCQDLYGLALVVASQDRSAVGSGPEQRDQAAEEGLRAAAILGYGLGILPAVWCSSSTVL